MPPLVLPVHKALAALLAFLLQITSLTAHSRINLNVYYEPQDLESTTFMKGQLLPTLTQGSLGAMVNLRLVPYGRSHCDNVERDYLCTCPHGDDECELLYLQACILHDYRDHTHILDTVTCIQGQPSYEAAVSECVETLPEKQRKWYSTCSSGFRGHYLAWLQGLRTRALGIPLHKVPFLVLDGQPNPMGVENLRDELCSMLPEKPTECS